MLQFGKTILLVSVWARHMVRNTYLLKKKKNLTHVIRMQQCISSKAEKLGMIVAFDHMVSLFDGLNVFSL